MVDAGVTPNPTSYTRFQRMLLGTDGSVTHILEAYAEEPIDVVKLLQRISIGDDVDPALELSPGDEVLHRQVVLQGRQSGRSLLYAEALIAVARVPRVVLDGLLITDRPMGILLAENRTEAFREILDVGREAAGELGAHFGLDGGAELIWRRYRIVIDRRPVMLIGEKFPSGSFRDLPA